MTRGPDKSPSQTRIPRRRGLLSGKLVYGPTQHTLDCAISDMSQTGARIRLEGALALSDPLYLIDVTHGLAFMAKEIWRRDAEVGLSFQRYFDLRTPVPELPSLVRRLWVEQTRSG